MEEQREAEPCFRRKARQLLLTDAVCYDMVPSLVGTIFPFSFILKPNDNNVSHANRQYLNELYERKIKK